MTTTLIPLKALCAEKDIDPREARSRLRWAAKNPKAFPELAKAYKPGQLWQWEKDSAPYQEAVKAIQTQIPKS